MFYEIYQHYKMIIHIYQYVVIGKIFYRKMSRFIVNHNQLDAACESSFAHTREMYSQQSIIHY